MSTHRPIPLNPDSASSSADDERELEILGRCLDELGRAADKASVVADYCARYPELADKVRALAQVGQVLGETTSWGDAPPDNPDAGASAPDDSASHPSRFGPYQVVGTIGRGGMGEVYEAEEEALHRRVAVKTIRRGKATDPGLLERFDRERQVLARLHHTHIVPILATGHEGDLLYFAMPFIPGVALNQVIRTAQRHSHENAKSPLSSFEALVKEARSETASAPGRDGERAPLDPAASDPAPPAGTTVNGKARPGLAAPYFRAVAATMADVAQALHHAHLDGIIHRDLKPSNIMVEPSGHPWVLDFGLARLKSGVATIAPTNGHAGTGPESRVSDSAPDLKGAHSSVASLTVGTVGTLPYMAPEQFRDGDGQAPAEDHAHEHDHGIDARTDVWGLGATLYELLTLARAFGKREQILAEEPRCPRELVPNLPRDLEAVCLKALRKNPKDRYQNAQALANDLHHWLDLEPTSVRREPVHRLNLWRKRNPILAPVLLVAASITVALLVVGFIALEARAARLKADAGHARALQAESEQSARNHQRAGFLQTIQRIRLTPHGEGWSRQLWNLVERTEPLGVGRDDEGIDRPLQSQAVASLIGLDVRLAKMFKNLGASSLAFDRKGERLLLGGVTDAGAMIWDNPLLSPRALPGGGIGPVGFRPDGTPIQLVPRLGKGKEPDQLALINLVKGAVATRFHLPNSGKLAIEPDGDAGMSAEGALVGAPVQEDNGPVMLHVWDGETGKLLRRIDFPSTCVAFSPDRLFMAAGDKDGRVGIWSLTTGQSVGQFAQGRMRVQCLAFGRNAFRAPKDAPKRGGEGWLLAAGDRGATITIYDVGERKLLGICRGSQYEVLSLAFSPDGSTLASGGREPARLWDVATGRLLLSVEGDHVTGLTFSSDGKRLVFGASGAVTVWELDNGRGVQTLRGLTGVVEKTIISPDGRLVAGISHEWQVAVWDLKSGTLLQVFNAPQGSFIDNAALAFSPDGRRLAFSGGHDARLWDLESGEEIRWWSFRQGQANHEGFLDTLAFASPDQLLLLRMETKDGTVPPFGSDPMKHPRVIRLRNLLGPEPLKALAKIEDFNWHGHQAVMSPDGRIFAVEGINHSSGKSSRLINAYEGSTGKRFWSNTTRRPLVNVAALRLDPSGKFLAFRAEDSYVGTLIEISSGRFLRTIDPIPHCLGPGSRFWLSPTAGSKDESPGFSLFEQGHDHYRFKFGFDAFPASPLSFQFSTDGSHLTWGNTDGSVSVCNLKEIQRRLSDVKLGW